MLQLHHDQHHVLARAVTGILALVLTVLGLHALDHPAMALPTLDGPASWSGWAGAVGPVGVLMALVRMAAIALAWYVLAAAVLHLLARVTGAPALHRLTTTLTTATTRDLLVAVLGTGLVAAVPMGSTDRGVPLATHAEVAAGTVDHPPSARPEDRATSHPPSMTRLTTTDDGPWLTRTTDVAARPGPGRGDQDHPSMHRLVDEPPPGPTTTPAPGDGDLGRWVVEPGDHFWRVAETQVTAAAGAVPPERRVAAYWKRLVAVNRDLLVDPGNPDLLLPGQVLRLPPVVGRGS